MHFLCLQNFNNGLENKFAMKMQSSPALYRQGEMTSLQVNRALTTLAFFPTQWGHCHQRNRRVGKTQGIPRVLPGTGEAGVSRAPVPAAPCRTRLDTSLVSWQVWWSGPPSYGHGSLGLGQGKHLETLTWLFPSFLKCSSPSDPGAAAYQLSHIRNKHIQAAWPTDQHFPRPS